MQPIVHLIDDDEGFRKAMSRILRIAGYQAITYNSAGDFLLSYTGNSGGCMLLDVCMPGPSGLDLQAALAAKGRLLPIIFLSGHGSIPLTVRAMRAGAVDFLTKPVSKVALLAAVKRALEFSSKQSALLAELEDWRQIMELLTPRQREVLEGVVAGKLNKQIAADLGISERTIKAHRAQVMEKARVQSVAQLVHVYHQMHSAFGGQNPPQIA
jgi:FixJ family two-component response regulator